MLEVGGLNRQLEELRRATLSTETALRDEAADAKASRDKAEQDRKALKEDLRAAEGKVAKAEEMAARSLREAEARAGELERVRT